MLGKVLRRLLSVFVDLGDISDGDVLVFDTSSLSHAFEGFSHAAISAYLEMGNPRVWGRLKARLARRFGSEEIGRKAILRCDTNRCLMPVGVYKELRAVSAFSESLDVVTTGGQNVVRRYVTRKSGRGNPIGFPTVFKPRILIKEARKDLVDYVLATARMMGKNISRQDAEGIALAIETGGILITADRKQAEVADRMGAKVLYTIPTKKLPVTLGRSP